MNSRQIREVQVADEVEAGVVNQLILAYQTLFTAADLVDVAIVGKDHLRTSLRRAEFAVAGHNVQLAKRHLCKSVAISRRRGELIALAGHLADIGSSVAPFGAPAEDDELGCELRSYEELADERASEAAEAIEANAKPYCTDCGNAFADDDALTAHQAENGGCPVAQIRDLELEAKQLDMDDSEALFEECGVPTY